MSTQEFGSRPLPPEPDRYLQWDAAYVLGALSSAERREYEHHLAGCSGCQRSVSELAGLPGLLAQVSPEDAALLTGAAEPSDAEPMPELLTDLTSRVRDRRRRRIAVAIGSVAAALVLLIGGVGVLIGQGVLPIGTQSDFRVAFSPVVESGITANVDVTPGRTETKFRLECQYARAVTGSYTSEVSIWIRDRSGSESELYSWYAKPNKVMRPSATARLATWRIDRVELRDTHTGQILSTAPLR
ncbi:anti-sigma factor family protein [Microlunatus ginsengisoli]|uniref:Zf-HC2 domain-containing protein n=1 Tax=Microlunatus ginsengisoli TaxID=363863 RepID=A0ABP7AK69_9ACTN